jgi:acetyl-CoA acyltransferase
VTLDSKCGSAQQAIDFAAQGVIAGAYDVVIAGGVEMMSLCRCEVNRMGKDNEGARFHARYPQGLIRAGHLGRISSPRATRCRAKRRMLLAALAPTRRRTPTAARAHRADRSADSADGSARRVAARRGHPRRQHAREAAELKPRLRRRRMRRVSRNQLERDGRQCQQVTDGASAMLIMEEKPPSAWAS